MACGVMRTSAAPGSHSFGPPAGGRRQRRRQQASGMRTEAPPRSVHGHVSVRVIPNANSERKRGCRCKLSAGLPHWHVIVAGLFVPVLFVPVCASSAYKPHFCSRRPAVQGQLADARGELQVFSGPGCERSHRRCFRCGRRDRITLLRSPASTLSAAACHAASRRVDCLRSFRACLCVRHQTTSGGAFARARFYSPDLPRARGRA
jgi:hypothetical protein